MRLPPELECRARARERAASAHRLLSDDPWPSIWTVPPDGTQRTRILRTQQNAKRPRLSPDGRWVVFDGTRPGLTPISDFDIQLVRRNGRGLRTLTRSDYWDNDAQWSPDGRLISFSRTIDADWTKAWIWTVRPDGTAPRSSRAASSAAGRRTERSSRSNRPRRRARATSSSSTPTGRTAGRCSHLLSSTSRTTGRPTGRRILFTRYSSTSSRSSIYVVNVDGTGLRRLGPGIAGSFSPDGSQIVYTKTFEGTLSVMRADGSGKHPLRGIVGAEPDWR